MKQSYKWISCLAVSCLILGSCEKKVLKKETTVSGAQGELFGTLSNGMSYFIKENPYDDKKASLRLAVKVGSVFEEEDERGLAHFLEHMVFRGTESYSDGEVVKYLESIGASFGADTNAYTSYDETVYMLEIPLQKEESLEKAFSILSEFAMKAKLSREQLEVEKGVVLDELRLRESAAQGRVGIKLMEILLQDTLYGQRSPIGLEEVIKSCSEEKMRSFYSKWYRPENMAIIAVGDFSSDQAMSYVNRYFDTLPTSESKIEFVRPSVSSFKGPLTTTYKDPETVASYFVLGSWLDNEAIYDEKDFKQSLVDLLVISMTNRRLEIKAKSSNPPFQHAVIAPSKVIHPATLLFNMCICWDEDPLKGLDALALESQKIKTQDFNSHEFEIAIATQKASLKTALENTNKHKNTEYASHYLTHFMHGGSLFSFEESAKLGLQLLETIELKEVNARKGYFFDKEQSLVYLPSSKGPEISKEQMTAMLLERDLEGIAVDNEETKRLHLDVSHEKGFIVNVESFEKTQVKKLTLSNGIKVYIEPSKLKENLFSFSLKASNGLDSYDKDLFPSASVSSSYLQQSGLAGLSSLELKDALAGKNVSINYYMDITSRNITGESSNEDMQTAFKLVHAFFTDRTYREDAWNQQMKSIDEFFALKEANPDIRFYQFVNRFNSNDHFLFEFYNSESMDKLQAEDVLAKAFSNPSEFTLVVAGDYNEKELILCLEKYLASIPSSGSSNAISAITAFEFPEGTHRRLLDHAGIGHESLVILTYPINSSKFKGEYKDFYEIALAENIINTRLLKKLRAEAGETYGVSGHTTFLFYPKMESGRFVISFPTSPETVDKMTDLLFEEVRKVSATPPTPEEMEKAVEIYKHNIAKSLQNNVGKVERIFENLAFDLEPAFYLSDKQEKLSLEGLHEVMKNLFDVERYTLHIKVPSKSPN